jgi:hypothetical protein
MLSCAAVGKWMSLYFVPAANFVVFQNTVLENALVDENNNTCTWSWARYWRNIKLSLFRGLSLLSIGTYVLFSHPDSHIPYTDLILILIARPFFKSSPVGGGGGGGGGGGIYKKRPYYPECGEMIDGCW